MPLNVFPVIPTSGEWLVVLLTRSDGSLPVPGISPGDFTGLKLTVDGVDKPLTGAICNFMLGCFLAPLGPPTYNNGTDDADPTTSKTGTWTTNSQSANACNGSFQESITGTFTWTITLSQPGRYLLSAHLWDFVGPDRTTDALYTVKDGSGTTLATFHRDLTKPLYPTFDRVRSFLPVHDLGHFTLAPGQTTVSVTLSNPAGVGKIFADALIFTSDYLPLVPAGSDVTVSIPAGAISDYYEGPIQAISNMPVRFITDAELWTAIDPPSARTLKVGFNVEGVRNNWHSIYFADRSGGCSTWRGDVTLDAHFEMVSNTGVASRKLIPERQYSGDNNLTPWGFLLYPEGVHRFQFHVSGATFDASARNNVNVVAHLDGQPRIGPKTWTDLGGGNWEMALSIQRPLWKPISTRSVDFNPCWSPGIDFVANTPGVVYTNWKWFDSQVPADWTNLGHPVWVSNYKDKCKVIRSMDVLGTNFSPASHPGDYTTPADRSFVNSDGAEQGFHTAEAIVLSIHPVNFDPVTDPDWFHRYFVANGYAGYVVLQLDRDPVAAGFVEGVQYVWPHGPTRASTVADIEIQVWFDVFPVPIPGNRLLCLCLLNGQQPYDTTGNVYATLTASETLTSSNAIYIRKNELYPPEYFFTLCNEIHAEPWVNFAHAGTDAYVDWLMDMAIAGTADGRCINGEYSNETWNPNFSQFNYFGAMTNHGNWLNSTDPVANPYTYPNTTRWMIHRSLQIRDRCRARLVAAGRDPSLLQWHFGSITQGPGVTDDIILQFKAEGATITANDHVCIEGYQDVNPPGGEYKGPGVPGTWKRISTQGRIDLFAIATFYGSRYAWVLAHRSKLDPAGYTACGLSGYETGTASPDPNNDPMAVAEMVAHPRMFLYTACEQQLLQNAGTVISNKYSDIYYAWVGTATVESDSTAANERMGTGDPAENPNAVDYPNIVAQQAGGRLAWAAGHDFSASTPPITPTEAGVVVLVTSSGYLPINVSSSSSSLKEQKRWFSPSSWGQLPESYLSIKTPPGKPGPDERLSYQ